MEFDEKTGQWVVLGDTITDTMHKAVRACIEEESPDVVANIESHFYHMLLVADSCQYDLDLGTEVWLNVGRWSRLVKEYIDKAHLERFIEQADEIFTGNARDGATANMMFRDPDRYAKKHRWGGCLMGATFRGAHNQFPTLTFFSRTTYIGYMGLLDAGLAHVMSQYITGYFPEVSFRWHISSAQLHCFKTLPFIFSQPDLMEKLEANAEAVDSQGKAAREEMSPTWWYITNWYRKILQHYEEHGDAILEMEKYGPFKRIKRRWLEHQGILDKALPPSLPISSLTLDKAYEPVL